MKQTVFWKRFDFVGQLLMLTPVVLLAVPDRPFYAMAAYFTVGAWQAISCGLTFLLKEPRSLPRKRYEQLLLCLLIIAAVILLGIAALGGFNTVNNGDLIGILVFAGMGGLTLLLFLGPAMAIWYAVITLGELRRTSAELRHRHELHWKL